MSDGEQTVPKNPCEIFSVEGEAEMITEKFSERTLANMEIALERACERLPQEMSSHKARKKIAGKILHRAGRGEDTLTALTDAALAASADLLKGKKPAGRRL